MEMYRRTYAEINLDHLAHNIRVIRAAFPEGTFLCPMVKANAYGHGDVQVARFLEGIGVQHLGVCLIEEGLLLRNFGVKTGILVFRGFDREGAKKIIDHNMTPVVSSWEHIDHLEAVASAPVEIHLKFDTGMNRLGFRPEEAQKLSERIWQNPKIKLMAVVTHLFHGEDGMVPKGDTEKQLDQLQEVFQVFQKFGVFAHALNSAGILSKIFMQSQASSSKPLSGSLFTQNWGLRPGLMIYGYNPLDQKKFIDLKPVMSLKSIASVYRYVKIGETVSYGGTWKAQRASTIAVVPIGYADGYHRILSNQAFALFAGKKVPVIGRVCMDYLMLDVTDIVAAKDLADFKDAEVVLFGKSLHGEFLSPEDLAVQAQTITWEMLTSVGERVPRVIIGGSDVDRR